MTESMLAALVGMTAMLLALGFRFGSTVTRLLLQSVDRPDARAPGETTRHVRE
jgi:hypothetical protein